MEMSGSRSNDFANLLSFSSVQKQNAKYAKYSYDIDTGPGQVFRNIQQSLRHKCYILAYAYPTKSVIFQLIRYVHPSKHIFLEHLH